MTPSFEHLMNQALRLTQSGNLQEATEAIQAALGVGRAATDDAEEGDTAVVEGQAREVGRAPPTPSQAAPAAPSSPASAEPQFIAGSHSGRAGTRDYKLFVPPHHTDKPLPLVVMLHGCTQSPDDFAAGTRMNEAALARGFLVLYPAQAQKANPSRCWNWFKHNHQGRDRGEPAILAGMTREVMQRFNADPRRVYVAGLSAGGAMAAILGDAYPDLYAAVGVHSGLATGAASDMASAFAAMNGTGTAPTAADLPAAVGRVAATRPPTIVFHGDADSTVHPINGERVVAPQPGASAPEVTRVENVKGRGYTLQVFRDAQGHAVAEHWLIHGAGHGWSGGSTAGSYTDPQGPSATDEMLRFFEAQALSPRRR